MVEVDDVRQLVRDDEVEPIVEIAEARFVDRRTRVDGHAIRRRDLGEAVREIGVVGDENVDRPARKREERGLQRGERDLGAVGRPASELFEADRKGDARPLGLERAPRFVRRNLLGFARGGHEKHRRQKQPGPAHLARARAPRDRS
ncbi:MAG: hypothetical protein LC667_20030 [Thioalkalivibrio sp.]|nr:hypothetical protein [Thioalkalivibrio sp.]